MAVLYPNLITRSFIFSDSTLHMKILNLLIVIRRGRTVCFSMHMVISVIQFCMFTS